MTGHQGLSGGRRGRLRLTIATPILLDGVTNALAATERDADCDCATRLMGMVKRLDSHSVTSEPRFLASELAESHRRFIALSPLILLALGRSCRCGVHVCRSRTRSATLEKTMKRTDITIGRSAVNLALMCL